MLIAKLKKVQSYLIGSNEDLALEQRLLLLSLLIGTMMGSIGSITNYITTSNILAFLCPLFLAICTTILYYFVRFKNVYRITSYNVCYTKLLRITKLITTSVKRSDELL